MRTLTPFIWTPQQPIHQFSRAGMPPREEAQNRWFHFRRTIELSEAPERAIINITTDGHYALFVNGTRLGRGPVRCNPLYQRFDTYDLTEHLIGGRNVLAVLVHTYGADAAFYELPKGLHLRTFGDGGLWIEGEAAMGSQRLSLRSDEDWRVLQSDAWVQDVPRTNNSLGFIEILDGRKLPERWTQVDFDDADWDRARELKSGNGPWAETGAFELTPFATLLPSGIEHLVEQPVHARRIVWIKGQLPDADLPIQERAYRERLVAVHEGAVTAPEQLLRFTDGNCVIRTQRGQDVSVLLDFGRILTGRPRIQLEAQGGEVVEIACCERLPGEWDAAGPASDARITPVAFLGGDQHVCRYIARPGTQVFESFEWCAIRWMQVTVRDAPAGLKIRGLVAMFTHYPVEERGKFTCSDQFLNELWSTGAYTLMLCMHDAWEDCPSREQRQWLGDATVESLAGHAAFGPCVAPLNAKFLLQAAESQRPDGLTQMFAPGDHGTDRIVIPDWTLQWILNAGDHYRLTGDNGTIDAIFPSILKALAWFERLLDEHGLISDMPDWHFMDWADIGRGGESCALNAQLAGTFDVAANLAEVSGWQREAARLRARSQRISAALNARHWDERRGVYVDSVDSKTGAQHLKVSQHANAAVALWTNSAPQRIQRALDRITESHRLTFTAAKPIAPQGQTLDPENGVVVANTFYAHFVYEALCKHGRLADALRMMRERFGPMLARGATTLWESFEPSASLCHGFSASPTYQLSRRILGITPASPGFAGIEFSPDLANLDFARGVVPSLRGDFAVSLQRNSHGFTAQLEAPAGVCVHVKAACSWSLDAPPEMLSGKMRMQFVAQLGRPAYEKE
jgi:alpha-L-rhamnosidase